MYVCVQVVDLTAKIHRNRSEETNIVTWGEDDKWGKVESFHGSSSLAITYLMLEGTAHTLDRTPKQEEGGLVSRFIEFQDIECTILVVGSGAQNNE